MRSSKAFSLIEIMVVVVIMGLLAGAVAVNVVGYTDTARHNRALSDIATIVDAVEAYRLEHGRYPTSAEGLSVLPLRSTSDPWGNTYGFVSPGRNAVYEVFSLGSDGVEGGEDSLKDIGSWDLADSSP